MYNPSTWPSTPYPYIQTNINYNIPVHQSSPFYYFPPQPTYATNGYNQACQMRQHPYPMGQTSSGFTQIQHSPPQYQPQTMHWNQPNNCFQNNQTYNFQQPAYGYQAPTISSQTENGSYCKSISKTPKERKLQLLPEFDGEPGQWPIFITEFKKSTKYYQYSDFENIARLRLSLKGKALESVKQLLVYFDCIPLVIDSLQILFGDQQQATKHEMQENKIHYQSMEAVFLDQNRDDTPEFIERGKACSDFGMLSKADDTISNANCNSNSLLDNKALPETEFQVQESKDSLTSKPDVIVNVSDNHKLVNQIESTARDFSKLPRGFKLDSTREFSMEIRSNRNQNEFQEYQQFINPNLRKFKKKKYCSDRIRVKKKLKNILKWIF